MKNMDYKKIVEERTEQIYLKDDVIVGMDLPAIDQWRVMGINVILDNELLNEYKKIRAYIARTYYTKYKKVGAGLILMPKASVEIMAIAIMERMIPLLEETKEAMDKTFIPEEKKLKYKKILEQKFFTIYR